MSKKEPVCFQRVRDTLGQRTLDQVQNVQDDPNNMGIIVWEICLYDRETGGYVGSHLTSVSRMKPNELVNRIDHFTNPERLKGGKQRLMLQGIAKQLRNRELDLNVFPMRYVETIEEAKRDLLTDGYTILV